MTGCYMLDFGKPARQNGKRLPCERLMEENVKLNTQLADVTKSMKGEEYWKSEALRFESWFYRTNYLRTQQEATNVALRELVSGLTWCANEYACGKECPLYDTSEPDHCREMRLKRDLGIDDE